MLIGLKSIELSGVTTAHEEKTFSVRDLLNQSFQSSFEKEFIHKTGLHGYLIKSDNQLNYLVFHQLSSNPKSNVILGNDRELLERTYLRANVQLGRVLQKRQEKAVSRLVELHQALQERDIPMLVLVSPNKAAMQQEAIPSRYRLRPVGSHFENLNLFVKSLTEKGVPLINGYEHLKRFSTEQGRPVFANTGTHWNQLGGCVIAAEVFRYATALTRVILPEISCTIEGERTRPAFPDTDLLHMTNLWWPEALLKPAPLVVTRGHFPEGSKKPRLLIIGSSFMWEFLRQVEAAKVAKQTEFLYYFQRRSVSSADPGNPLKRATFDFDAALKEKTLVLIEINQSALGKASFGFAEHFLLHVSNQKFPTTNKKPNEKKAGS